MPEMVATITPPSAPMMNSGTPDMTVTSARPEPDDIPESAVPPALQAVLTPPAPEMFGEHEALLRGFCQHLQGRLEQHLRPYIKDAFTCIEDMHAYLKHQLEIEKEKIRHAETALDKLVTKVVTDGVQVRHDPYQLVVQAVSPEGYGITIQIAKTDAGALLAELPQVLGWLTSNHYTRVP
jgi:hypothetical protein